MKKPLESDAAIRNLAGLLETGPGKALVECATERGKKEWAAIERLLKDSLEFKLGVIAGLRMATEDMPAEAREYLTKIAEKER